MLLVRKTTNCKSLISNKNVIRASKMNQLKSIKKKLFQISLKILKTMSKKKRLKLKRMIKKRKRKEIRSLLSVKVKLKIYQKMLRSRKSLSNKFVQEEQN